MKKLKGVVGLASKNPVSKMYVDGSIGEVGMKDYAKEELEINHEKAKELMGEENWKNFIKETLTSWLTDDHYSSSNKIEKFLRNEGILATKREKGLDNLLEG